MTTEGEAFTSPLKTDIFCCLIPSLSLGHTPKKPRSFSFSSFNRRVFFLSQVFTTRSPEKKKGFSSVEGRQKPQRWQVHPGDTFQPRGLTPTPVTRWTARIFSPRRSFLLRLEPRKEKKSQSIQKKSQCVFPFLISQYL